MSALTTFRAHCRREAASLRAMPASERALWAQLADEVDAYLAHDPEAVAAGPAVETGPALFEEAGR